LEEHGLKGDVRLHEIKAGDVIKLGSFPWSLSTSTTPSPTSSPWPSPLSGRHLVCDRLKFDHTPIDGKVIDLHRLAELGREGFCA